MCRKLCNTCLEIKDLSSFCVAKGYADGHQNQCKKCRSKESSNKRKTKDGVISSIYSGQKSSSIRRGLTPPSYTKKWLKNWLLQNPEFHRLYDMWVLSNYDTDMKPSVDRKDDYIGYTEYNIQLMTWRENLEKSCRDKVDGINNKQNKAVVKLSKENEILNIYFSIAEAGRQENIDFRKISDCCLGKIEAINGFKFSFYNKKNKNKGKL